jgi:hypothetical protein
LLVEQFDLGPGFPEWTEIGQDTGLDPLAMQRPIELVFQSLLPGISTITLRLRYYSFFAWLLEAYAKRKGVTSDYDSFRRFHRKAEALFALTSARGEVELGVAGIDWARRQLEKIAPAHPDAVIDFREAADPTSDVNVRYLRNIGGAFGAIYASQMQEMGLIKLDDRDLPVPFCKDSGLALAESFQRSIGDLSEVFLDAVDAGQVSVETLDRLAPLKPSKIGSGSQEQRSLSSILMGRHAIARPSDQIRAKTLRMLLHVAQRFGRPPRSEETKWTWFGARNGNEETVQTSDLQPVWALYQTSDLLRLAYETLLTAGLNVLRHAPRQTASLSEMVGALVELTNPTQNLCLKDWLFQLADGADAENLARASAAAMLDGLAEGDDQKAVQSAWSLIAVLIRKSAAFDDSIMAWLGSAGHFQSLVTERRFIEALGEQPAATAIAQIVADRILRRHLWVASRKFRNQKAYTYLFEPDDGAVRYRDHFRVAPSSPRLDQAVQFLRDVRFLNGEGVTEIGSSELEPA